MVVSACEFRALCLLVLVSFQKWGSEDHSNINSIGRNKERKVSRLVASK